MKTCPFCKAEIQDNARFCLYCMKPLAEKQAVAAPQKKKRLWPFLVGIALLLAILLWIFLPGSSPEAPDTPSDAPVLEEPPQETAAQPETTLPPETTEPPVQESTQAPQPSGDPAPSPEVKPPKPTEPEATLPPATKPEVSTQPETTVPETTQPPATAPVQTGRPVNPAGSVVYTYRPAESTDDLNAHYTNPGDHIVITGVSSPSGNGEYIIPAYIDGQRVISVDSLAFTGVSVKKLLIEDGVKNVFANAFSDCADLTDIYIEGTAVMISTAAFPAPADRNGLLTFHCSAQCHDRTYNFYKTGAAYWYGGAYEEWNG